MSNTDPKGDTAMSNTPDPFPWGDVFDDTPATPIEEVDERTFADAPELSEEERAEVDRIEAAPAADLDADERDDGPPYTHTLGDASGPTFTVEHHDPAPFTPEADLGHREAEGATYGATPTVNEAELTSSPVDVVSRSADEIRDAVADAGWDAAQVKVRGDSATYNGGPGAEPPTAEPVQWIGIEGVEASLDNLAELATRNATCRAATDSIVDAVRKRAAKRAETRPDKVKNTSDIRRELVGVTRDGDVLADLAAVFTAGAAESKAIVGDLMDELPVRGDKPRMSAKVADGDGFELKITRSKRTELKTDDEVIDDVLAAFLIRVADDKRKGENPPAHLALTAKPMTTYAAGVRDAIGALRNVLSASPGYRSTALDALVKVIQSLNEDELAKRLERAYGRVEKGEASIKYDRVPLETPAADETPAEVES